MTSEPDRPALLLVGGARPISSSVDIVTEVLTQARDRGVRTHVINEAATLDRTSQVNALADAVSAVDPDDPEACLSWARRQRDAGGRFEMVLGLRDPVLAATAECAALFGAPGNPPDAVWRTRNKDVCREALTAAGFLQPAVRLCTGRADALAFMNDSVGPWVVKPRDSTASIGVVKVADASDLTAAIGQLPCQELFLIEEFVEGQEFSAEGVFLGGSPRVLAVTERRLADRPGFIAISHAMPAELPEEARAQVEEQVGAALTALGLRFGVFHTEFWLTADGVVVVEVHARPGGDWLHKMLGHVIPDLELFGLVIDDLLGRPVTWSLAPTRAAAVRFMIPPPGRLLEIRGWDRVLNHPNVLHAELFVGPGDVIAPIRQEGERSGVVVVGADTTSEALALATKLAESVDLVMEREPAGRP